VSEPIPQPRATHYRGRLAPSPTGYLHVGHARTFWVAMMRARTRRGTLVLRIEDLDPQRSRAEFVAALLDDLKWFGFTRQEGPDCGGPFGPYQQSARRDRYRAAFERLRDDQLVYPCACSRRDIQSAVRAPHAGEDESIYPGTCRPERGNRQSRENSAQIQAGTNWRFRVPDGEAISFLDGRLGPRKFVAGRDFGDFVVWRNDDVPAYQLAVVVDDAAMRISEVVRGEDLLRSTARQVLLYRALGLTIPDFFHCPLITDEQGTRLAKRHDALSLRALRQQGRTPEELRAGWSDLAL
jgi:glutamyl/glutaminyl-tRNA synthetase